MSEKKRNFLKFIKSGTYTDKSGTRTNTDRAASRVKKIDLDLETMKPASTKKMLSGGQAKIAAKAPPPNKIDAKDFAVLRAEKAKGRGMGLQDEKVKPGKVMKARKGLAFDEKLKRQNKGLTSKTTGKPTSLKALREMKGFRPGETPSQFNQRMDLRKAATKAAKSSRIGKIVLPIAAAGVAAQQYLKSKMKKKDEPKKKMGGGMMKRPMGLKKGSSENPMKEERFQQTRQAAIAKAIGKENVKDPRKVERPSKKNRVAPVKKTYMGGGMMKRPMGYRLGAAIGAIGAGAGVIGAAAARASKKISDKAAAKKRDSEKVKKKMGGGMMQRPMGYKGGGMDTGRVGEMKSGLGVLSNKLKRDGMRLTDSDKEKIKSLIGRGKAARPITKRKTGIGVRESLNDKVTPMKKERLLAGLEASSRMGGGMMQRPMGYNKGTITKVPGGFSKEGSGRISDKGFKGNSPSQVFLQKEKRMGGRTQGMRKKMGGGMMMKPMGYKSGTSVKAKCKLGRNKPTKMY